MTLPELASFTPVSLSLAPQIAVDWGDLRGMRFVEPFFDQTVERWAGGNPPPRLIRTDLAALLTLDKAPSLDPSLIICHLSRCGSTLLPRLLGTIPGVLPISEPGPLNSLLMADSAQIDEARLVDVLRLLVRALGRRRFGDEAHYVLKLSSWNVRRLTLFRRAFPEAKVIWVQRDPAETMASLLADPPSWMQLRHHPEAAHALFGFAPDADRPVFCAHALAAMLEAVRDDAAGAALIVDYTELPGAIWTRVAPLMGLTLQDSDIARMGEEAAFYSKDAARRVFVGDAAQKRHVSDDVRALARQLLHPLYCELDQRRRAAAS